MAWYSPKTDKQERNAMREAFKQRVVLNESDDLAFLDMLDDLESAENMIQSLWKEPQDRAIALLQEYPPQVAFSISLEEKLRYRSELATAYDLATEASVQLVFAKSAEPSVGEINEMTTEQRMAEISLNLALQRLAQAQGILMLIESWCLRDRERSKLGRGTETIAAVCKPEEAEAVAKIASDAGYGTSPLRAAHESYRIISLPVESGEHSGDLPF